MYKSQFSYCHLVWMFCLRQSNSLINKIHGITRRISYKDQKTSYQNLLETHICLRLIVRGAGRGRGSYCIFWNFSPPEACYYDPPPQIKEFSRKSYSPRHPTYPFNYHPLILWNFLVKLSSAKWKSWVKTKWENYSEDKQS